MGKETERLRKRVENTAIKIEMLQKQERSVKNELKYYEKNGSRMTRRERTHRLCTRGAILEKWLKPYESLLRDNDVEEILQAVFDTDDARKIVTEAGESRKQALFFSDAEQV